MHAHVAYPASPFWMMQNHCLRISSRAGSMTKMASLDRLNILDSWSSLVTIFRCASPRESWEIPVTIS